MTSRSEPIDDLGGELAGLRALARSLVHGDAEAEDLLQDVAEIALVHPPDTETDDRPVRPWLATVLRNRRKMDRRAATRRATREASFEDTRASTSADPVEMLDRARTLERLSAALVALDEPFRTTVIRRYLDGETAAQIARALGVPSGTVRWRLKTGLDRLRAALDDDAPRSRWQRALVPLAFGKPLAQGALLVKSKALVISAIVLVLLLIGGAILWSGRDRDPDTTDPVATAARTGSGSNLAGSAVRRSPTTAVDAPVSDPDPLPGQGRATIALAPLPGGAIHGRVINWSTGDGVAGAELTFVADAATTVRTREDGAFELAPGAPGTFTLSTVTAPNFLPYAPEYLHSTIRIVLARDRDVRGVTVFLFPAVDYFGRVVDGTGAPVAGAIVKLLGTTAGEQVIDKLATEWTTDRDGKFTFHAADDAVLEATRGGKRGRARLDGNVAITKQLVITLGNTPARDATIAGRVVDDAGAPIAEALVRALPAEKASGKPVAVPRATAFATSGADGTFVIEGVDRESYILGAQDEDHASDRTITANGGARDLTLVLDRGQQITGTVVASDGAGIPAYTLLAYRRIGAGRELVVERSIIDPTGAFAIRVGPGDYELLAAASGWAPSAIQQVSAGATGVKLVVTAGATLRGIVVAAEDGKTPLPHARVMREARGGGASAQPANAGTVTRVDGTFELTGIPPGPVAITIAAHGRHPRIEAGMTATDGAQLGPITIALKPVAEGETPKLELVGIGVKLAADGDALRVDGVIEGGGAAAAGILAGDRIIALDGATVGELGLDGAVARIRGVVGTTIAVSVKRGEAIVAFVVERRKLAT